MLTKLDAKRLKAIHSRFVIIPQQCTCCEKFFSFKELWNVKRRGMYNRIYDWWYCKDCMPTTKDVLHEIDTDACPYGIAFLDDDRNFKKDTTRLESRSLPIPAVFRKK